MQIHCYDMSGEVLPGAVSINAIMPCTQWYDVIWNIEHGWPEHYTIKMNRHGGLGSRVG